MPRGKKVYPKYVEVYNEILKLIVDGQYPEGSKMPTEDELSASLNVSRMTLRQALMLLKEDGVIEARRGSGNYVRKVMDQSEVGLEKAGAIVHKICSGEITHMDIRTELKPSREYVHQIFKRKSAVCLNVDRYYKGQEEQILAYALTVILTDVLDEYELDLSQQDHIRNFLETVIYEKAHRIRLDMKVLPETQAIKLDGLQSRTGMYLGIFEQAYDQTGRLLVHTKYYVAAENAEIRLNWHNS